MMSTLRFSVNLSEIVELTLTLALQRPSLNNPDKTRLNPEKGEIFHVAFIAPWMGSILSQAVALTDWCVLSPIRAFRWFGHRTGTVFFHRDGF